MSVLEIILLCIAIFSSFIAIFIWQIMNARIKRYKSELQRLYRFYKDLQITLDILLSYLNIPKQCIDEINKELKTKIDGRIKIGKQKKED